MLLCGVAAAKTGGSRAMIQYIKHRPNLSDFYLLISRMALSSTPGLLARGFVRACEQYLIIVLGAL